MTRKFFVLLTIMLVFACSAWCDTISFSGSSGSLSAKVTFDLTGSTLTVTLVNTSSSDVLVPTDVLTAVFFNTTHLLTPVSASLNGSSVFYGSLTNVGAGWQYKSGVSAGGKNSGISATGLGVFGPTGNFFAPGVTLGGVNYGILSAGDNSATGNGGITNGGPLIKNSIVFTLTAGSGFSLSELGSSVVFQYGTSLTETEVPGNLDPVPEPATLLLLGSGLSALGLSLRRHR